jgi:flagellar hook-associated protein 2
MISSSIANNLGFGSGIDTAALVNDLATASRGPKVKRLEALAQTNKAKISALAQARSDLDSFSRSLGDVTAQGTLRSQPVVSDETAISATATGGVKLGNLASEIEVTQLAKSQTVYSGFVAAAGDPVGQGNLTLSIGGVTHAITITPANDSLTGLADAINASGSNVRANIITDGNGARLVIKGETGAAKAFTLTADVGAAASLDRFTFGGPGSAMTLGQAALDATFTLDGVAFTRSSNSITDIIPGVNVTLKKPTPGASVSIGAKRPLETIRQTINDFVGVFNTLKRNIAAARVATGGDGSMRALDQQLSNLVSRSVTSDTGINSLSDIGIATGRDGTISINAAQLEAAITANPDAVEAIFNPVRDGTHSEATDPGISLALKSIKDTATAGGGVLDGLKTRLEKEAANIATTREKMETREDAYRLRLEKQFGSMDARLGAIKATQTYLEQQIKLWSNAR